MNRPGVLRILFLSLSFVLFASFGELAFAGAHGGGGGFHGGGGGFHGGGGGYHGGGGYGGWHGSGGYGGWHGGGGYGGWHGGYGGYHGGYGGWHGGYGGYYSGWRGGYGGWYGGGWGWGWPWGFGISFNFGGPYYGYYGGYPYAYPYPYYYPYYPYPYSYAPGSYAPGAYAPTSDPSGYADPGPSAQVNGSIQNNVPLRQPAAPASSVTLHEAVYRHPAASVPAGAVSYRPASAQRQLPPMRPEVQNVIRALRAMPPAARQQQIESGRYSNLSPQEMKLVRDAADVPAESF